jgi:hypothetical protein
MDEQYIINTSRMIPNKILGFIHNSSVEIYEQNGGFAAEKRGKGRVNYFF